MKWRTIGTDTERMTGIAPVCPLEASAAALAVFLTALDAEPCS